jgi:hypothetical protein
MTNNTIIVPLRIANEAFLVSSMIERCPKTMMIRELVVNGLEAAEHALAGSRRVVIGSRMHEGVRKLHIWNTGIGMTAQELLQITDLASSLRKQNSLEQNFGMGAKVASLPSNRQGLRYRSCASGRVSEVMLGYRDGTYGRLKIGNEMAEVVDATEACLLESDYDLSVDWTEVVLFGNAAGQDTVSAPYNGTPKVDANWIGHYLENRFFRLPKDVILTLLPEIWGGSAPRDMIGLDDRRFQFGKTETRTTPSGVKLHYYYDPPEGEGTLSAASAIARGTSRGAVIFRDEMYDVRSNDIWLHDSPIYGIPFGAKYVSAFVELPDDYLVWPEAYRQFLRFRGNDQKQVYLADFSALVRIYMPAWLSEIIQRFGPRQADYLNEIGEELKALLAALGVAPQATQAIHGVQPIIAKPPGTKVARVESIALPPPPVVENASPKVSGFERPPEIIALRSVDQVKERALEGRAARFYPQSHQIFVNLTYPAVQEMAAALVLERDAELLGHEETIRRIAFEVAELCIIKRIARAIIYSLSKKSLGWRTEDVNRGQSPESLSLIADDWAGLMEIAKLRFQGALIKALSTSTVLRSVAA